MRKQILSSEEHNRACEGVNTLSGVAVELPGALQFTKVDDYTTFWAEYGVKDEDNLVFHFFVTEEVNQMPDPWKYWKDTFPRVLQEVAVPFFKSGPPALRAAYTEELASWWLQADGAAGKVLDADHFAKKFLQELDKGLDDALVHGR